MDCLQARPKQQLEKDLGDKIDFDLKMTLTVDFKLLNLSKITIALLIIDTFDSYLVKRTLMTKPTFWQDLYATTLEDVGHLDLPLFVRPKHSSEAYEAESWNFTGMLVSMCTCAPVSIHSVTTELFPLT